MYNHKASFLPLGSIASLHYAFALVASVGLSAAFLQARTTWYEWIAVITTVGGLSLVVMAGLPFFIQGNNLSHDRFNVSPGSITDGRINFTGNVTTTSSDQ